VVVLYLLLAVFAVQMSASYLLPYNLLHGFGYAENREVRIKNGFAYAPFTIKGAEEAEYDFDDANTVYANATLTITGVNDISFETHRVSTEKAF
jgi:hypothetical protein